MSCCGRPTSSHASRRAVSKAVSVGVSALPVAHTPSQKKILRLEKFMFFRGGALESNAVKVGGVHRRTSWQSYLSTE